MEKLCLDCLDSFPSESLIYGRCRECVKARRREYYTSHREQIVEQAHRNYIAHRAHRLEASRRWAEANPEKRRAYRRAYYRRDYAAHRERYAAQSHLRYVADRDNKLAYTRRYYAMNKAEIAGRKRVYYLANRERILEACRQYRDSKKEEQGQS